MIARSTATALGCRSCQGAVVRAVLSSSATPSYRTLPRQLTSPARATTVSLRRAFATKPITKDDSASDNSADTLLRHDHKATEDEILADTPWFLEVDPPRHVPIDHKPVLPNIPKDAPKMMKPMLKYIHEDMGLDDLALLDLRDLDPPAALGSNLIMLLGTARSERHLHVSSGHFVRWLKRKHKARATADGLIGPGELKTKLRRLRKKAELMGTNSAIVPGGDNGISTGWICVRFSLAGDNTSETVKVDDDGRFSGFGIDDTRITIVVQCMTEARRSELDLESLWQGALKQSYEREKKISGDEAVSRSELDAMVATKVQLPKAAAQWQAMKTASQSQRSFSTMARRLQADTATPPEQNPSDGDTHVLGLEQWRTQIQKIQVAGLPIREEVLPDLISALLSAPSSEPAALQRLELVDSLLLTAQERGMNAHSPSTVVALIAAMATSPDYGPELKRAQENLELVMRELDAPLEEDQILRLMSAYAKQADWDKFWDVFRSPSRFNQPRTKKQYLLAYQTLVAVGNPQLCIEALRWVYPEMVREQPPVLPVGDVYDALKACILVADPVAEDMLRTTPPREEEGSMFGARRYKRRECLKILREVELLHRQCIAQEAQAARARLV